MRYSTTYSTRQIPQRPATANRPYFDVGELLANPDALPISGIENAMAINARRIHTPYRNIHRSFDSLLLMIVFEGAFLPMIHLCGGYCNKNQASAGGQS